MDESTKTLKTVVQCLEEAKFPEAQRLCEQVIDHDPTCPRAHYLCGVAHANQHQLQRAVTCFQRAIELDDQRALYFYNLGVAHRQLHQWDSAIDAYQNALQRRADFPEARNNLANALMVRGRHNEAIQCFSDLIRDEPNNSIAYYNLGNLLHEQGELQRSLDAFHKAISLDPDFDSARENLGRALADAGQLRDATKVWCDWLTHDPDNPIAKHMLASLGEHNVPSRCDDDYVRRTFDADFADTFDVQLSRLDYRGPTIVQSTIERLCGNQSSEPSPKWDILDAGCGTGLAAAILRPVARRLDGVDLSPAMLAKARQLALYDELVEDELTRLLRQRVNQYDLIVCVDTLCYFGDLMPVLAAARSSLRRDGLLVFSVERLNDRPSAGTMEASVEFKLQPNGRYRHTADYVRRCAEPCGLGIKSQADVVLRRERGMEVPGLVFTLAAGTNS